MPEIYVATDIEADGPIPGDYSMISLGSVAYREGREIDHFYRNLSPLDGASKDYKTMEFWKKHPEAYKIATESPGNPDNVMCEYHDWLLGLGKSLIFVAWPTGFDFTFVYWYLMHFVGDCPFSFSALDFQSYGAAIMNKRHDKIRRKHLPPSIFDPVADGNHDHNALNDARCIGNEFMRMLEWRKKYIRNVGKFVYVEDKMVE